MVIVQGVCGVKMKQLPFLGIVCTVMLFIVYRTTTYQYRQTEVWLLLPVFLTLISDSVHM